MVVGICRCKDELDVLPFTLAHMLDQVDQVIVEDNGSTDSTLELLRDLAAGDERLIVQVDDEVAYYQSAHMSRLAAQAADLGATWVIPWDADELWYSPFGRLADVLGDQPAAVSLAALYDRVPTARDSADANPLTRIAWRRRDPAPLPKVACRPRLAVRIEQGNHDATFATTAEAGRLVVFHYPLRSPEQMIRKARNGGRAYAATDLPQDVGQHWRDWDRLSDEQLGEVFREHYWSANPAKDRTLIYDPLS